jgi:hypothetical protein
MGCGQSNVASPSAVALPGAESRPLPTMLQSSLAHESIKGPQPIWKASHYNQQLALQNLAVLAKSTSDLEKLQCDVEWGMNDVLNAVDPMFRHYYGIINAGIRCPFMSAEEVIEYFKLTVALCGRWDPNGFECLGQASQVHAICEILEYLDEKMVPIDECDLTFQGGTVRKLINMLRATLFPQWIKARMWKDDICGKACLVTGRQWGMEQTDAYQAALERLLRSAEGEMNCRYDDNNNCCVTKAWRVGEVVHVNFEYTGNKIGPANEHDPRASVIGWDSWSSWESSEKIQKVTNVKIAADRDTGIIGTMEFHGVPAKVENHEIWFRFSKEGLYTKTYLNFDHANAKLLPSYWNRKALFPQIVSVGSGLSLRRSENVFKALVGKEHQSQIGATDHMGYNMFSTQGLEQTDLLQFQRLFDNSLRKKFTRDRRDGMGVPDRLLVTRGYRCQNVQNWVEYSRRRWQIKEELHARSDLPRSIDNLKTAGVFPNEDRYHLDSNAHEEFLFHGTNDEAAASITKGDFLVNLAGSNAGTLYGKGVYLAESVSKSDEYTKENGQGERCILVCRATLGAVSYTDEVAPDVDALVESCTKGPYHCVLGDREKCRGTYREIIVYDDDQVYPEYVIWYKRVYEDQ